MRHVPVHPVSLSTATRLLQHLQFPPFGACVPNIGDTFFVTDLVFTFRIGPLSRSSVSFDFMESMLTTQEGTAAGPGLCHDHAHRTPPEESAA